MTNICRLYFAWVSVLVRGLRTPVLDLSSYSVTQIARMNVPILSSGGNIKRLKVLLLLAMLLFHHKCSKLIFSWGFFLDRSVGAYSASPGLLERG